MADDLRRFVADLRDLRESRGVSLQRIQSDTRIPIDVLRQFEDSGLEGIRTFNHVYLRSLLRVYSQSIGIAYEPVLKAYDHVLEGRYAGIGAEAFGGTAPEGDAPPAAPASLPAAAPAAATEAQADGTDEDVFPEAASVVAAPDASADADAEAAPEGRRTVEMPRLYDGAPVFDTVPERPGLPSWAYGLLALVVLAALGAAVMWWMGRPARQNVAADAAPVADTLASADSAAAPAPALPATLPAELRLTVRAAGAALSPVRIVVDQDVRRPYWIDPDSSRVFTFVDSVSVYDLTPTAELLVEGMRVDTSMRRADGSYRVRRADLLRR